TKTSRKAPVCPLNRSTFVMSVTYRLPSGPKVMLFGFCSPPVPCGIITSIRAPVPPLYRVTLWLPKSVTRRRASACRAPYRPKSAAAARAQTCTPCFDTARVIASLIFIITDFLSFTERESPDGLGKEVRSRALAASGRPRRKAPAYRVDRPLRENDLHICWL